MRGKEIALGELEMTYMAALISADRDAADSSLYAEVRWTRCYKVTLQSLVSKTLLTISGQIRLARTCFLNENI